MSAVPSNGSAPATRDELERRVLAALAAALDREPATVALDASLVADLGAESLDFLDISFRLEEEFHVRMPRLNVIQRTEDALGKGVLFDGGRLTSGGAGVLRRSMPEIDPARLVAGLTIYDVGVLITPRTFVRLVERMLQAKAALPRRCAECGGTLADAPPRELRCAGCGRTQPLPDGDDVLLRDLRLGEA
jgi:acyl carrier protein